MGIATDTPMINLLAVENLSDTSDTISRDRGSQISHQTGAQLIADMRTRGLVLYCAGASSRGLFIRHNIAERERVR